MRDPLGIWNYALFARRRGPGSPDINFNLAAFSGALLFEFNTDAGAHLLRMPLSRIEATAWHDLVARYDGAWLQLWCDGTLHAEMPCRGAIKPTSAPVLIGAATEGDKIDFLFTGEMEEAAFWNRALTDADLAELFRRPQLARDVPDRPTPATAGLVEVLPGEAYRIGRQSHFIRFSPDGRFVFFHQPKGISVWDVAENREARTLPVTGKVSLYSGAISPNGKYFAANMQSGMVYLWDIEGGQQIRKVNHGAPITALAFSADSALLATAGSRPKAESTVQLWEVQTGNLFKTLNGFTLPLFSLAFDKEKLYAVDGARSLYRYDFATDQIRSKKQITSFSPYVRFSPDLKQMAFLKSGRISLWDIAQDMEIRGANLPADARPAPNGFDVTEDGRIALVALVDPHRLVLLDLLNGTTLKSLEGHHQFIRSAALAPDGKRAFSI